MLSTCCFRLQILVCDHPECRFGRQHAALHGCVRAFDLGHVHEARTASDQHAARERQLGNGLEGENVDVGCYTRGKGEYNMEYSECSTCLKTSFVEGSGSISDPVATFQGRFYRWVMFPTLEFLERAKVWISVVQANLR